MDNTKYWIALQQIPGIGPAHMMEIHEALNSMGLSIIDLYELETDDIKNEFNFHDKVVEALGHFREFLPKIEQDYFDLLDAGIDIIPFFSSLYPERLHETLGHAIPPILYTLGNNTLLRERGVAILGDKDISDKGELISFEAAKELARHNLVTISGYAKGADMIAHRSALVNDGLTVAFVPYGMKYFKPVPLLQEVFDPGRIVIVSTFYPTQEANKYNAFIRNKIICALSKAVYIVEAPEDGGIFEAAKSAQKLEIPLFTTEYSEYPKNAGGNVKIMEEMKGKPIKGRREQDLIIPNMDAIIGIAKFG